MSAKIIHTIKFYSLLSTGLEPMTLALSEPRATNCAKRAKEGYVSIPRVARTTLVAPNVGLEPTTTRLRVLRSAD
jgi:hypothetical protein